MNQEKPKYIIAGNWKMFKNIRESVDFFKELDNRLSVRPEVEILIFPPFTSLFALKGVSEKIRLGAQNIFFEERGAFTGEISPLMLEDLVGVVLAGHSERRQIFRESDDDINKKVKIALQHGFRVVLCIGESLEERESGKTFAKLEKQLQKNLENVSEIEMKHVAIAYEPIWAIGTGKNATPDQAQDVHAFIRGVLKRYTPDPSETRILYGGSVKPENSHDILSRPDINGVLVGGASLNVDSFFDIITHSYKLI